MSICFYIWGVYYGGVEDFKTHYKLNIVETTIGLTFFPFLFLYIKSVTDEAPLNWKAFLWFLPSILIGGSSLMLYLYMGEEQAAGYIQQVVLDHRKIKNFTNPVYKINYIINIVLYYTIFIVQIIWGMRYTISYLINYRKRINSFYSNPEGKSLENIKAILIGVSILLFIFLLGIIEAYTLLHKYPLLIYLLMIGYATTIYFLNHQVALITYTARNLAEHLLQSDKEAEEKGYYENIQESKFVSGKINTNRRKEIISQLDKLLNEEQIFLRKDLRMDDFVRLTQTNRTYISLFINEEYQCNFSELINRKRIEHAQKLALANPNLSHIQLADESGFTHASSFSRTFKQHAGMPFREWQKEA